MRDFVVACWGETFLEKLVGGGSCLWEAINCTTYFDINIATNCNGVQIILVSHMLLGEHRVACSCIHTDLGVQLRKNFCMFMTLFHRTFGVVRSVVLLVVNSAGYIPFILCHVAVILTLLGHSFWGQKSNSR